MEHAGTVAPSLAAAQQQNGSGLDADVGSSQASVEVTVAGELAGALAAEEDNPSRGRCREAKPAAASGLHHARRVGHLPHSAASALCLAKMRAQSPPRSSSDDSLMRHSGAEGGATPLGAAGGGSGEGGDRDTDEDGMLLSRNGLVADQEKIRSAQYEAWTVRAVTCLARCSDMHRSVSPPSSHAFPHHASSRARHPATSHSSFFLALTPAPSLTATFASQSCCPIANPSPSLTLLPSRPLLPSLPSPLPLSPAPLACLPGQAPVRPAAL